MSNVVLDIDFEYEGFEVVSKKKIDIFEIVQVEGICWYQGLYVRHIDALLKKSNVQNFYIFDQDEMNEWDQSNLLMIFNLKSNSYLINV